MRYKLVCIDMDGTLLNSKKKVSSYNRQIIKRAHALGVHIVITTGRIYENAAYFSKLIGVKSPVIASNGAIIKDKDESKIIYKKGLDFKAIKTIIKVCSAHKVKANFNTHDSVICSSRLLNVLMKRLFLKSMSISRSGKLDIKYVSKDTELLKVVEENYDDIIKCEIIDKSAKKIMVLKEALKKLQGIEVVSSSRYNIEITSKYVSKGRAVEALAKYYGINREEIISIGDSENDLSMIEYAGFGVAMGNAQKLIKDKADYITDTNDKDGVGKAIKKFILDKE